jgi:hypothetical protein
MQAYGAAAGHGFISGDRSENEHHPPCASSLQQRLTVTHFCLTPSLFFAYLIKAARLLLGMQRSMKAFMLAAASTLLPAHSCTQQQGQHEQQQWKR